MKIEEEPKILKELISALEEYQKLLSDELDDTGILAMMHGWRSKRVEEGKLAREKIELIKEKLK